MAGRNWTRRSIEEMIDAYLRKQGIAPGGGDVLGDLRYVSGMIRCEQYFGSYALDMFNIYNSNYFFKYNPEMEEYGVIYSPVSYNYTVLSGSIDKNSPEALLKREWEYPYGNNGDINLISGYLGHQAFLATESHILYIVDNPETFIPQIVDATYDGLPYGLNMYTYNTILTRIRDFAKTILGQVYLYVHNIEDIDLLERYIEYRDYGLVTTIETVEHITV